MRRKATQRFIFLLKKSEFQQSYHISMKFTTLLLCSCLLFVALAEDYTLQLVSTDRGARCLDGSPAGYYYHLGKGVNKDKFMIYMDSGGYCHGPSVQQLLQSCYKRRLSTLGTTTRYKPSKSFDNQGLLSTLPQNNPVFHDWTKIFFIYCDGSEYTGHKEEPISYKDALLYFRGYDNVKQQFRSLSQKFDFYNKDTIVLTGVSSGALGTFYWSNYLVDNTKTSKVLAMPDSGIFLMDFQSPWETQNTLKSLFNAFVKFAIQDSRSFPIHQCAEQFKGNVIECFIATNLAKYIKAPTFIINSHYDEIAVMQIVYTNCYQRQPMHPPYSLQNCNETVRQLIEKYRLQSIEAVRKIKGDRTDVGLWSPSCVIHGFTDAPQFTDPNYRVPSGTGPMVYEAIAQFLQNPYNAPWYQDTVSWPDNTGCSGLQSNKLRYE